MLQLLHFGSFLEHGWPFACSFGKFAGMWQKIFKIFRGDQGSRGSR
jgi:hypothetical protein